MGTSSRTSEHSVVRGLQAFHPEGNWVGGLVENNAQNFSALVKSGSWAAMMRVPGGPGGHHWVIVSGVAKNGNVQIKDVYDGTKYEMKKEDFDEAWNGVAIFSRPAKK